ncbi:helix-turn-helix domain-containing protein [Kitasatospora camelliae]|uniref:Helix-turn-helix domain-containing protein n=1 Tax=Kitasatospora camelliae TaxID=3156397 RepID=A0AAU8JQ97_9ACTN
MLTVGRLAQVRELGPAVVAGAGGGLGREVRGVAVLAAGGRPGSELAGKLVRVEGGDGGTVRRLAGVGAAGLAVAGGVPEEVMEAAERAGLAVLGVAAETDWFRVAQVVADHRVRMAQERVERLEKLLAQARERDAGEDRGDRIERITSWLAGAVGGSVALCGGRPEGSPAGGWTVPPAAERAVRDLAAGRLRAAALDDGELRLQLVAVGRRSPYPVLVVGRREPFDRDAKAVVTHTADLLALLLQVAEAEQGRDRLAEVASSLRLAVFQLLMGGEVTLAQRSAEGLGNRLLDTDSARVYVLEGPAAERDRLAAACAEATEGRALVVRCPAYDQHLIVVAPLSGTDSPAGGTAVERTVPGLDPDAGWDEVGAVLLRFVADHPERFLGGSGALPLSQTAGSYGDATRALAIARLTPVRAALYAAESRLVGVLDPLAAGGWAAAVLRPLRELPYSGRDQMLGTLQLGLEFPATSAGRILGVSRNTVRARLDRAAGLIGLDLSEVGARAVLHLALRLDAARGPLAEPPGGPVDGTAVDAAEVLSGPGGSGWARTLLARLDEDGRDLRTTLLTWLEENTGVERTARRLGLHPQTVREHLRGAELLLCRQLLSGGGGLYEVALAFAAVGALHLPRPEAA